MKVKLLIEKLERFDEDSDIVIRTQKGHQLFGDIGIIDYDEDDEQLLIMDFTNEGYSPKQALRLE